MSARIDRQPVMRRKKACDLCFAKKIKCDQREPRCSNCVLYKAQCCRTAIRHRVDQPRPRPEHRRRRGNTTTEGVPHSPESAVLRRNLPTTPNLPWTNSTSDGISDTNERDGWCWTFDPISPRLHNGPPDKDWSLPALDEIMPILDQYFRNQNPSNLLFDQDSFMRMVTRWYSARPRRDTATWASILVVIALGIQTLVPDNSINLSQNEMNDWLNFCMRNAQSVLPELAMRDEDLMGVQVLTTLAILFRNSFDTRPAGILAGMAVGLAYRMQLHSNDTTHLFTADEVLERSNVFWTVYMLDKSLSVKGTAPSIIFDVDISIPRPPQAQVNSGGILWTEDGYQHINVFRRGVELAYIEGMVYEQLYSNRSAKLSPSERQGRIAQLQDVLNQWYADIPTAFTLENVSHTVVDSVLVQMTYLFQRYLHALVAINGVWSGRAEWMKRVSSLSRAAINDIAASLYGPKVSTCLQRQNPPGSSGWKRCVDSSRGFMRLFRCTPQTPHLIWQSSCAHFSGIITILSNILISQDHESRTEDFQLATASIELQTELLAGRVSDVHESLYHIVEDLRTKAESVVSQASEQPNSTEDMVNPTAVGCEPPELLEQGLPLELGDCVDSFNFELFGEFAPSLELDGILSSIGE